MSIIFNGTEVTDVVMDGVNLNVVLFNNVCVYGSYAVFESGESFRYHAAQMVSAQQSYRAFLRSPIEDRPQDYLRVESSDSMFPIYLWMTGGTNSHVLRWATEAQIAFLNPNSATMFRSSASLTDNPFRVLTSVDFSDIYTDFVENADYMFEACNYLENLDLGTWNTIALTSANGIFYGCGALEKIYASSALRIPDNSREVFYNCHSLVGGSNTHYDASHIDAEYARIDDPEHGKPGYFTLAI